MASSDSSIKALVESHSNAEDVLSDMQILFDCIEKAAIALIDHGLKDEAEWIGVSIRTLAYNGEKACDETTHEMVKTRGALRGRD